MILAFYKGKGRFFDRLIRWWTRGPFSHVEVVLDINHATMSALCLSASPREGTVREKVITLSPEKWDLLIVPWGSVDYARSQTGNAMGQRYDWFGIIFSQILPTARHHRGKWFCSELCAKALGLCEPHRYSPTSLHNVVSDISFFSQD